MMLRIARGRPLLRLFSTEAKKRKVKVALVSGYLGTGYHGVQLQDTNGVPTVENEVRAALFKAGCILESNLADLSKIGWSRSSRTDKGVHASCIVFSAKLLVDSDSINETDGRLRGLPEAINAHLPPSIRMFTATKVHQSFRAREDCTLREYEYFLPLSFLAPLATNGQSVEAMADTILATLPRYEGIFDFHNFTKQRGSFYKEKDRRVAKRMVKDAMSDDDEVLEEDDDEDDDLSVPSDISIENGTRRSLQRHRRTIYRCRGSLIQDFHGSPYLRVHLTGASFLLNQIRCMVGAAIAVATGHLSPMMFDAALETNQIVRVPTAPAEGLVLSSCALGGKRPLISLVHDHNTPSALEMKKFEAPHRILLTSAESDALDAFCHNVIYKEVDRAWKTSEAVAKWPSTLALFHERFLEQQAHLPVLQAAVDALRQNNAEKLAASMRVVQQARCDEDPIRCLPRAFSTSLCIRFGLTPGNYVTDLLIAVKQVESNMHVSPYKLMMVLCVQSVLSGIVPVDATEDDLLAFVEDVGVDKLAARGQRIRLRQA